MAQLAHGAGQRNYDDGRLAERLEVEELCAGAESLRPVGEV
jgi:hypothetical protein